MLPEQQQRILGYFIEEAKDHLNTIEQGLLNLQSAIADTEMINEMFRAAHSIKGGAAMLGVTSIQHSSHRLEDYFKVLRECPGIQIDQELESLLLNVFDILQDLLEQLQGPYGLSEDVAEEIMAPSAELFAKLNAHIEKLAAQAGGLPANADLPSFTAETAAVPPTRPPAPAHAEASALQLFFKSDIPGHLRDMLQLFKQDDNVQTRQQLQDICGTLVRAGEQFDLANWCTVTRAAQQAIANPNVTYRSLAPVVIKDLKQAQDLVLANQFQAIAISPALQDLLPDDHLLVDEAMDELLSDFDQDGDDLSVLFDADDSIEEDLGLGDDLDLGDLSLADMTEPSDDAADLDWLGLDTTASADEPNADLPDLELGLPDLDADLGLPDTSGGGLDLNGAIADEGDDQGPEVGAAELNSLADLFQGDSFDLSADLRNEDSTSLSSNHNSMDIDIDSDFSDLLAESEAPQSVGDDLADLFGDDDSADLGANEDLLDNLGLNGSEFDPDNGADDLATLLTQENSEESNEADLSLGLNFDDAADLSEASLGLDFGDDAEAGEDFSLDFGDDADTDVNASDAAGSDSNEFSLDFGDDDATSDDLNFDPSEDSTAGDDLDLSLSDDEASDDLSLNFDDNDAGSGELTSDLGLDFGNDDAGDDAGLNFDDDATSDDFNFDPSEDSTASDDLSLNFDDDDAGTDAAELTSDLGLDFGDDDAGDDAGLNFDDDATSDDFNFDPSEDSTASDDLSLNFDDDAASDDLSLNFDDDDAGTDAAELTSDLGLDFGDDNAAGDDLSLNFDDDAGDDAGLNFADNAAGDDLSLNFDDDDAGTDAAELTSDLGLDFGDDDASDDLSLNFDDDAGDDAGLNFADDAATDDLSLDFGDDDAAGDDLDLSLSDDEASDDLGLDFGDDDAGSAELTSDLGLDFGDDGASDAELDLDFGDEAMTASGDADTPIALEDLDELADEADLGAELDDLADTDASAAIALDDSALDGEFTDLESADIALDEEAADNVSLTDAGAPLAADLPAEADTDSAADREDLDDLGDLRGAEAADPFSAEQSGLGATAADPWSELEGIDASPATHPRSMTVDDPDDFFDAFASPATPAVAMTPTPAPVDESVEPPAPSLDIPADDADLAELGDEPDLDAFADAAETTELTDGLDLSDADDVDLSTDAWDAAIADESAVLGDNPEADLDADWEGLGLEDELNGAGLHDLNALDDDRNGADQTAADLGDLDGFDGLDDLAAIDDVLSDAAADLGEFDLGLESETTEAEGDELNLDDALDLELESLTDDPVGDSDTGDEMLAGEEAIALFGNDDLDAVTNGADDSLTDLDLELDDDLDLGDGDDLDFGTGDLDDLNDLTGESDSELATDDEFSLEAMGLDADDATSDNPDDLGLDFADDLTAAASDKAADDLADLDLALDSRDDDLTLDDGFDGLDIEGAIAADDSDLSLDDGLDFDESPEATAGLDDADFNLDLDDLSGDAWDDGAADSPASELDSARGDEDELDLDLWDADSSDDVALDLDQDSEGLDDLAASVDLEDGSADETAADLDGFDDLDGLDFGEESISESLAATDDLEGLNALDDLDLDLSAENGDAIDLDSASDAGDLDLDSGDPTSEELELNVDDAADFSDDLDLSFDESDSPAASGDDLDLDVSDGDTAGDDFELSFDEANDAAIATEAELDLDLDLDDSTTADLDFGLAESTASADDEEMDALLNLVDEDDSALTDDATGVDLDDFAFDLDEDSDEDIAAESDPLLDSLDGERDELDALEDLLNAAPAAADSAANSAPDEFADLDDLLNSDDDRPAEDDFAALEALLDTPVPAATVPPEDKDFDDLEKLLEDADQNMGGTPTVKGVRSRTSSTVGRRSPGRRSNVLSEQSMRVSVKHLDSLSNLVGELVVNRNTLEQDQERLRQFLDNLLYQVQQLSDVGQRMRDLYERSLLESSLLSSRQHFQSGGSSAANGGHNHGSHATGASFDALEMDRFTGFHTLSQEMIELIVRVREASSDIEFIVEETDQVTRQFRQVTTQIQEGLMRSRMVPFAQTADRLPRAVRDISLKCGKQAELVVEGRETLIDKMILEQLYDPMTHLVNNAITHGIETPEERKAAGKAERGEILVRTFHQGNQTVIVVSDDGAGINPDFVKEKAIKKGLITFEEASQMTHLDVYDLLFHPGFSTRDQADDFAGRGVGMDVVRTRLAEMRGAINVDSTIGKGTNFTIRLPLTLSITKALSCVSNRARIAFPMDGVEDMLDIPKERIQQNAEGQSCILWRDNLLPFQPLSDLLKFNRILGRGSVYGGSGDEEVVSIVVLRSAGTFIALQVDQVLGEQEIVIKQLQGPAPKPLGIAGATVLGDGRIMPIADVLELIDLSMGRIRRDAGSSLWEVADQPPIVDQEDEHEPTVLIVDDSITVRELLSMSFAKVGYRVEQARDGQEAWEKLKSGLPCDLVFCDIEMPRMDGLELLSRMQKDPSLSTLPIAMLTSRGADRHRQMAVDLGASGYFTKPYLEEALLDAAKRMLDGEVLVARTSAEAVE